MEIKMKSTIVKIILLAGIIAATPTFAQRAPRYISPNNDGVQDSLDIPLRITDRRYVQSWNLIIEDEAGNIVRTIGNKESLPERLTFKGFWRQLFSAKKGVDIPATVSWNGAIDSGVVAPDGTYHYYFTATDDNGNTGRTERYSVVVDTTPPVVELVEPSDKIFGEGEKAEFEIQQIGSQEDEWRASFSGTDGAVVRSYSWKNTQPMDFVWNGTDELGMPVADGVYTYTITTTDRAGNVSAPASISNIIFSAERPATNITISGSRYFSPRTDSPQQNITFNVTIPVPDARSGNRLSEWAVTIIDENGGTKRVFDSSAGGEPPQTLVFDGTDTNGRTLADGRYQARVTARYLNGYEPTPISSPTFILDTQKPNATLSVSDTIFGAGSKNTITLRERIQQKPLATVPEWTAFVYPEGSSSQPVREFPLGEYPPDEIVWNGLDDEGNLAPNGVYRFVLEATDLAGNSATIRSDSFTLDTTEATLMLAAQDTAFSPNGDRVKDTITFTPASRSGTGGIVRHTFTITPLNSNVPVRTVRADRSLPQSFVWDGRNDSGSICPDGQYVAHLEVTSANDSSASADTQAFTLDTQAPSLTANLSWNAFSPTGESTQSALPVNVSDSTEEKLWSAEVKDERGRTVRRFTWSGKIATDGKDGFEWNGADEAGNVAPDGTYSITISSTDDAGNSFSTVIDSITLDTRERRAYITREHEGISPNGDGVLEAQNFGVRATVRDGASSWRFDICDEAGNSIRNWTGNGEVPANFNWDGLDSVGKAGEGTYTGRLQIQYRNGRSAAASSLPFVCSATPPQLSVHTSPEYFSPDNDGTDDDLFIDLAGSTKGRITEWSFAINDPNGRAFWTTGGSSTITERIIWDGLSNTQKDSSGLAERVQSAVDYPWVFTVKDSLGMSAQIEGIIPVDVLVIRDGDVLKMAVPSIIFRANHADFNIESAPGRRDGVTAEQAANNERVLNRVAQILNKFRDYKVTVVGHANRTTDDEAEETEDNPRLWGPALIPLSERRAEFVKAYLVNKGISVSRLSTEGKGGTQPVADWHDRDNNWKNRRVEFILQK